MPVQKRKTVLHLHITTATTSMPFTVQAKLKNFSLKLFNQMFFGMPLLTLKPIIRELTLFLQLLKQYLKMLLQQQLPQSLLKLKAQRLQLNLFLSIEH